MFFPQASFAVEEDIGELLIPVHRRGDVSEELMVVCYTQQGAIHSIRNLIYALVFNQSLYLIEWQIMMAKSTAQTLNWSL